MTDETSKGPVEAPKAVLYSGQVPLDVPIDTFLHAIKVILERGGEDAFLQKCKSLSAQQGMLLTSPELVNLIKSFFEEQKLYSFSTQAMEIMTSPPHKRCWPRNTI